MVKDCTTVWDNCLQTIRRNVNVQSFRTWFEPIRPVRLENNALTIQVPNKFFYEWLEEHYVSLLKMTIRKELGDRGRLEYQILTVSGQNRNVSISRIDVQPALSHTNTNGTGVHPGGLDATSIKNPFVIPGIKKLKIDPQLNASYTFETFIEGDCNRLARSAGQAVAKKPGGTAFNPLVIFGDVGLGNSSIKRISYSRWWPIPDRSTIFPRTSRRSRPDCRRHWPIGRRRWRLD